MRTIALMMLAAVAIACVGCRAGRTFTCKSDDQCGPSGACIANACAFPASDCPSGYRYDKSAGSLAGQCVPLGDMTLGTGGDGDVTAPPDMAATCTDGVKNGTETDVDCGGTCPSKCELSRGCNAASDCKSNVCNTGANQCVASACQNGVKDPTEADIDCGGVCPTKCGLGQMCGVPVDCLSGACTANRCAAAATCTDGVKNGDEADVDCGGSCPTKCATGRACGVDQDCLSSFCSTTCQACGRGMANVPKVGGGFMCIDAYEVTAAQYKAFLNSGPSTANQPAYCSWNTSYFPYSSGYNCMSTTYDPTNAPTRAIVCIDWCDAFAYCKFAGKRLCGSPSGGPAVFASFDDASQSQWYNACSAGGAKPFPYGSLYTSGTCNTQPGGSGLIDDVGKFTGCVGAYAGLYDMSGNAAEWEDSCDGTTGMNDNCQIRGGSFVATNASAGCKSTGASHSASRSMWNDQFGIRCCQ